MSMKQKPNTYMTTDEIREKYLDFFQDKNHKLVASDSLVPGDDPTLLFTGAGMNQFKKQFMGDVGSFRRATTSQKCIRTGDLDNVGRTPCHHTFFEMLGNFSFGDYFKKDAIVWAWELLTEVFKIPDSRLYVSVYKNDEEAFGIWKDVVKIPSSKIFKLGDHDNFWPADAPKLGPNGPCGPCSEIFYDLGREVGCSSSSCSIVCSCRRYVEIWNLVFTQFDRVGVEKLENLPNKNIDTGMGLERIASVLQGVSTNFQIDIFQKIIHSMTDIIGVKYGTDKQNDSYINAIADHIRAVVFSISDGVIPSNDQRGYVIRKLIRRAVWRAKKLGYNDNLLYNLVGIVSDVMKNQYPELNQRADYISKIVLAEEDRFRQTLEDGEVLLDRQIKEIKSSGRNKLQGEMVFKLYDTFGFPYELTAEIAEKYDLVVDKDEFEKLMDKQKDKARLASQIADSIFIKDENAFKGIRTEFVGYDTCSIDSKILKIISSYEEQNTHELVLDRVPFYAQSGGQVSDNGMLVKKDKSSAVVAKAVVEAVSKKSDVTILKVKVVDGFFGLGDIVTACVDQTSRENIASNHTATHILHAVLRKVLGDHIRQAGSLVDKERLRFDFTHFEAIDKKKLSRIEEFVNDIIRLDLPVVSCVLPIEEAKKTGAHALFNEKYGDYVRVLSIGDVSKEFCGGTHVSRTGQIGYFKIISESSISSGVRRIEALGGKSAYEFSKKSHEILNDLSSLVNVPFEQLHRSIDEMNKKNKDLERQVKILKEKIFLDSVDNIVESSVSVGNTKIVVKSFKDVQSDALRSLVDLLKTKIESGVFILGSSSCDKVFVVCGVTKDLLQKGVDAVSIVNEAAIILGGKGGGRKDMAFTGGKDNNNISQALQKAESAAKGKLT